MARLCEGGALAQSDFVAGQQVFVGGSIESLKIGFAIALDGAASVSEANMVTPGKLIDQAVPASDAVVRIEGVGGQDTAPSSEGLVITNV